GHRDAEDRGDQAGDGKRPEERDARLGGERRRRVDARAEEGGVPEAEVTGVATQDVPARGQRYPEEHEVEERLVEGGHLERGDEGEHDTGKEDPERAARAERVHRRGRKRRMKISSVNDTRGAQPGDVTAMVKASLAAMKIDAAR